jgi:hypothetical protein
MQLATWTSDGSGRKAGKVDDNSSEGASSSTVLSISRRKRSLDLIRMCWRYMSAISVHISSAPCSLPESVSVVDVAGVLSDMKRVGNR